METLLIFIGIIGLFMIFKFIYDTYLTNNTEKGWQEFTNSDPESAARIERNELLDFSTESKSKIKDKEDSILRMAQKRGCKPDEVKEDFISDLKSQNLDQSGYDAMLQILKEEKYEESREFDIDPDDTASAYMEKWTLEYFEKTNNDQVSINSESQENGFDLKEAKRLNEMGNDKFSKGEYEDAISLFNLAIQKQPKAIFYHNRADSFYLNKQIKEAKLDLHTVIRLEPEKNDRNIYSKLGQIYFNERDYSSSLIYFDEAIRLSPERKKTLYNRAVAHVYLNHYQYAIKDLNELINALPNHIDAHILLGNLNLELQNLAETKNCIDTINLRETMEPEFNPTEYQFTQISQLKMKFHKLQSGIERNDFPF